ncbi:MAG: hypothetical protein JXM71_01330, partial [Spirochaetales bacterium]|nr:hypothetical protein [Spirochaetales bacterium]
MSRGMLRWHIVVVLLALTVVCAAALPKGATFMADGPDYIAEAVGTGDSEAAAQNDALRAAIG